MLAPGRAAPTGPATPSVRAAGAVGADAARALLSDGWEQAMGWALAEAAACAATGDVPVGAVVIDADGTLVAAGRNTREATGDPTAHAEVVALRAAAVAVGTWRLLGLTLVVTLEPCAMCAGAAVLARVDRVVYAAADPKAGAAGSVLDLLRDPRLNHRPEVVSGVRAVEGGDLLRSFFAGRRRNSREPMPGDR